MDARDRIEGSWGIEPVPERLRVLRTLDTGLLWGNLGVSLLVIVAAAALVPSLSLPDALVAILLGCVIGNTMLGLAGAIGADARVPGMVLMRAPLGRRGSYLPTGVNVLQGLGWSVFELLIIATAAAALSDDLFGFRAQWLWTIVFGAFALVLALLGPIGFVRRFVRRVAIWAVPVALVYLTWWAFDGADLGALWDAPGEGGLSVWQGADFVVAITVSWAPLAADYTRFSTTPRAGGIGAGFGYFVPDAWLLALGVILVLSRDVGDPAALPAAVVAGGFAAILALFALLVTETDEAFANVYSAAVSLQNVAPWAPQKLLMGLVTAVAVAGALVIDLVSYQSFLLLLGSVFVPLFAVLLADWLAAGRHYAPDDVFDAPAWRPGLIAAWVAGFALYQWLYPTGPGWWVKLVERLDPPTWGIGATVPSFLVAFAVAGVVAVLSRRAAAGAAPRVTDIAAIGNLSLDVVAGAAARPGGGVFYAARALAHAGADAHVAAACAAEDRDRLHPALEAFGLPVTWFASTVTTAYSFHYEGERRIMRQDAVGDPWTPRRAAEAVGDARWIEVGALTRTDFPQDTFAELARDDRRLLVDAQGLVRTPALGPLRTDAEIGDVLRHVSILKLNEEEAHILVGSASPDRLQALGVPEVLLTLGSQGSFVVTARTIEHVPAVAVAGPVDPTGAGDTLSATYLAERAAGAEPVEATRSGAEAVAYFLSRA